MRQFRLAFFVIPALVLCLSPAYAQSYATYVAPQVLPPELLPPPPIEGGRTWKEELGAVLAAQLHVTERDLAAMRAEQQVRVELVTIVLGPDFNAERLPRTFALLSRVMADCGGIVDADKKYWHSRRPYLVDQRVKLLIGPLDNSPAYPSGHTAESRVLAEIISLLLPRKRDALRARAEEIAYHRLQAGVHYPADLEGGRLLAMLIVGAMIRSSAFQEDFLAAGEELKRVKPY